MKTLKESLLGNIENAMDKGEDVMNKLNTFGYRFKFDRALVGSNSSGVLNMASLKKLTANMDYMSNGIERGLFDKQGKIKRFANWIDHLPFNDLDINPNSEIDDNFRCELTKKLWDLCKTNSIFNRDGRVSMWVVSVAASGKDRLDIIVSRDDKISNAYVFKLYYTIEKI